MFKDITGVKSEDCRKHIRGLNVLFGKLRFPTLYVDSGGTLYHTNRGVLKIEAWVFRSKIPIGDILYTATSRTDIINQTSRFCELEVSCWKFDILLKLSCGFARFLPTDASLVPQINPQSLLRPVQFTGN